MKILKLSHKRGNIRVELSSEEILQIRTLLFDVRKEHMEDWSYLELLADMNIADRLLHAGRLDNFDICNVSYLQNLTHPNNEIFQHLHEVYTTAADDETLRRGN